MKTALTQQIKIGSMDRKVTFRSATESQTDTGFPALTWSDAFSELAALDYGSTVENQEADRQIGVTRANFTTRKNSNTATVTNKYRLKYDEKEYDIEGITEPLGRGRFLKFHCKLRD